MDSEFQSRLLNDLAGEQGEHAWRELDRRYRGALSGFAQRLGLDAVDAEELAQETLVVLVEACRAGTYRAGSGSLSPWLYGVVRNRVKNLWRQRHARGAVRGESALDQVEDEVRLSQLWEVEWRAAILREGLRRLREESGLGARTLAAFEGLALEGRDAAELGRELGLTANAVYQAKFRAAERLREVILALEHADHVDRPNEGSA